MSKLFSRREGLVLCDGTISSYSEGNMRYDACAYTRTKLKNPISYTAQRLAYHGAVSLDHAVWSVILQDLRLNPG